MNFGLKGLTDIDLKATHVLVEELFLGFLGVAVVLEVNECERSLYINIC